MTTLETMIGDEVVTVTTSGMLGNKLSQCTTAADLLAFFAEIDSALKAYNNAQAYEFPCYSSQKAWDNANRMAHDIGLSQVMIRRLKTTRVLITE